MKLTTDIRAALVLAAIYIALALRWESWFGSALTANEVVARQAQQLHSQVLRDHRTPSMVRTKALSCPLLAAAGCGDDGLFGRVLVGMQFSANDTSSMALWMRGRVVLGLAMLGRDISRSDHYIALTQALDTRHGDEWDALAGWALAYWVAAEPAVYTRWAPRLQQCAADAHVAARADPSAASTLLWTHAMNAYAAAAAGSAADVEVTCRAMLRETHTGSLGDALRTCPASDYPRWLASFFDAAVRAAQRARAARRKDDVAGGCPFHADGLEVPPELVLGGGKHGAPAAADVDADVVLAASMQLTPRTR